MLFQCWPTVASTKTTSGERLFLQGAQLTRHSVNLVCNETWCCGASETGCLNLLMTAVIRVDIALTASSETHTEQTLSQ